MTRLSKSNEDVRKGAWAAEEDEKLRKYVETYGTGHWRSVGKKAGIVTSCLLCVIVTNRFWMCNRDLRTPASSSSPKVVSCSCTSGKTRLVEHHEPCGWF